MSEIITVKEFVEWCTENYMLNPGRNYERNAANDGYDVELDWSRITDSGCGCCSGTVAVPPEIAAFLRVHGVS